jgi:hypothetical protein
VRRAYARAEFLDERVKMMQWWGDRLDAFKSDVERRPILSQTLFALAKGG